MQAANLLDIAVRLLLVVASVASFEPQITRIKNNGSCSGISVFYVLYTTMLATYSFALLLWGVLNHERGESYFFPMEEPGVADWLNFVQFAVVWLGQLVLFYLILTLPPSRLGNKRAAMLAYLVFVVISLVPTIAEQFIDFSNDTMSEHDWFDVLYIMMPMFVLGPIVQILGFVALWAQASEIKSRSPGKEDALSVKGLLVQAVVFLLVGLSFLWRLRIPAEEGEGEGYWLADLREWYWTVGFATINNLIFAVVQGVLAWIAWWYFKGDGGEFEAEAATGERTALLA